MMDDLWICTFGSGPITMNWSLVLRLSLFGLLMAFATVSVVPFAAEPFLWLIIFIICAYVIAKRCDGRYFMHGVLVGLVNSVWITGAHILFAETYMAHHPEQVSMMASTPWAEHPREGMLVMGPVAGLAFGAILGLFCVVAAAVMKRRSRA
jgi:hypothetical protein